jgi:hypothetical protein
LGQDSLETNLFLHFVTEGRLHRPRRTWDMPLRLDKSAEWLWGRASCLVNCQYQNVLTFQEVSQNGTWKCNCSFHYSCKIHNYSCCRPILL